MRQAIERQQSGKTRQRSRATEGTRHKLKTTCSNSPCSNSPCGAPAPQTNRVWAHTARRKRRHNATRLNEPGSGAQGPTENSTSGTSKKGPPKTRDVDAGEVAPGSNRDSRKTHVTLGISLGRTTVQWSVLRMEQAIDEPKPGERRKRRGAPAGSRHQLKTTRNQSQCHQLAGGCHSTGNQPRTGTGSDHSVRPTQATTNRHLAQGKDLRGKRPTLRNRLEVGGVCRAWDARTLGSARRLRTSKNGQGSEIT